MSAPCPWGGDNRELFELYKGSNQGECPVVIDKSTPSCGNSRFGCWTCTVVTKDRALHGLIQSGLTWMKPLLNFRNQIYKSTDPAQKNEYRNYKRRTGKVTYMRGEFGDDSTKELKHIPGPYWLDVRKKWLKKLLQIEKQLADSGHPFPLIRQEELQAIRQEWLRDPNDKLTSAITSDEEQVRTSRYATGAKALLKDFATELAKRKVKDLETEFVNSFYRLSRKEDINLTASIDPKTFTVSLLREDGFEVNKDELSAGEKQIYAISILEALARTSGRRLPIIIDTPLGRLDSVHRSKLINNYFPHASHQMLILSTDTEVDEDFYHELSPSISHAFKLDYEPKEGCTWATEAY